MEPERSQFSRRRTIWCGWALVVLMTLSLHPVVSADQTVATTLSPGQVVYGFSTVLRRTWWNEETSEFVQEGATLTLDDFAGKILFIEFYDPFCTICREGIRLTAAEIKDYYEARQGNAHGIPVVYMAINMEPAEYARDEADYLLDPYGIQLRGNDYTDTRVDVAVNLFATHSAKPVFVAINCVSNSPSHSLNELLVNQSGVVESQIPGYIPNWKAAIDAVQPPPPKLEDTRRVGGSNFEFTLHGRLNSTYRIASTTNFKDWDFGATITGTNGPILFRYSTTSRRQHFFRIVSP